MQCPKCGLENSDTDTICGCGYDFKKGDGEDPKEKLRQLRPYLSIWRKPRATIQQIIDVDPRHKFHQLVLFSAFLGAINMAMEQIDKGVSEVIEGLLFGIILAPIILYLVVYVGAVILKWAGRLIGGAGTEQNIRYALIWAVLTSQIASLIFNPAYILFEVFDSTSEIINLTVQVFAAVLGIVGIVMYLWSMVIGLKILGQVQGFSAWKALMNYLVIIAAIVIPFVVLAIAIPNLIK